MAEKRWNIPESWQWSEANEFSVIIAGGTPRNSISKDNYSKDGIPWLTPADLSNYHEDTILRGKRSLSIVGYGNSSAKLIPQGSVLFTSRAPIGYCVIAGNEISTNQGFKSFVPAGGINPYFLRYYLINSKVYAESKASGTTFLELSGKKAGKLSFPIAPLNEQKRITDKIDSLFDRKNKAKKALDAIPALLNQYRQSILAAAFQGTLTKDWRGNIREGWTVNTVGSIINNIQSGKSFRCIERPPKANEKGIVKISAVSWGRFNEDESKTVTDISRLNEKAKIFEGDLLFSRANTIELVGACLIANKFKKDLYLSDKILRLEVPEEYKVYLKWFLRSPSGRKQIERMATGAQHSMRNISQSSLKKIMMPLPPKEEMLVISQTLEEMGEFLDQIHSKMKENGLRLGTLKQSILAKAFRGKLVPQDPNDEPVVELLKHIQNEREQLEKELKTKKKVTRNKPRGRNTKMIIPVIDALKQSKKPLSSQQLLSAAGYPNNANIDQIEHFFLDVRKSITNLQIEVWRDDNQDYFKLAG
ncbi:MAG: hypothetical protein COA43_15945 [Robiginitomaculum sp.]|nr:MAG: hypothetical protein COA43_15945 [Robiginitomaculum sp.]